jgi:hypothetical protein
LREAVGDIYTQVYKWLCNSIHPHKILKIRTKNPKMQMPA